MLAQLALTLCIHPIVKHAKDSDASIMAAGAAAAAVGILFGETGSRDRVELGWAWPRSAGMVFRRFRLLSRRIFTSADLVSYPPRGGRALLYFFFKKSAVSESVALRPEVE